MLATIWCIPQADHFITNASLANDCTLVPTQPPSIPVVIPTWFQQDFCPFIPLSFPSSSQVLVTTCSHPGCLFVSVFGTHTWNTWFGRLKNQGWGRKDTKHIGMDDSFYGTKMSIHGFNAGFVLGCRLLYLHYWKAECFLIKSSFQPVYRLPVSPEFPSLLEIKASGRGLLK